MTHPDVLVAMNEPSLRKFYASVRPGGWILYNGSALPGEYAREDIHVMACDFMREGDALGDTRAANMVVLGALLEIAEALPQASIDAALRRCVSSSKWVQLDERAIERGRQLYRELPQEVRHEV